jgi:D-glycero-alpha-D-manno-heptose 1-phosphate guanylyltransferase
MDCIILAGGLGTRLRSVVSEVPKCMATVAGKPFLCYLLKYIENQNKQFTIHNSQFTIKKVVLAVGYLREVIFDWIEKNQAAFSFEFDFAVEETPLGTGGGIRLALEKTTSEKVLILNGDTFFDVDLYHFVNFTTLAAPKISIALKQMTNFERYGTVTVGENNVVQSFNEKQFCAEGLINGGVYIINTTQCDLRTLPEKFSFETEVLQREVKNGTLAGFVDNGYFIDIGIPEDYAKANTEFKNLF